MTDTNTRRETGRKAQLGNITAARAVADIIRTTLGPRSMLKMLLDPMGGIVMTNDGNCILREVRACVVCGSAGGDFNVRYFGLWNGLNV